MKLKPRPRTGDTRTRKKFAFFPKELGNTDTFGEVTDAIPEIRIWWESYYEDQFFVGGYWHPTKRYQKHNDNTTT